MAAVDADHYPERLASITIVNAPRLLAFAWRVIRKWLDEVTQQKVDIVASADLARERLLLIAEPSELARQYGGTGPELPLWPAWPLNCGLPPLASPDDPVDSAIAVDASERGTGWFS